ncbi:hypothetical protein NL676_018136 [Syzygium grande]|nr:hypothetical protein NL676_018136 [Syzygium grande]
MGISQIRSDVRVGYSSRHLWFRAFPLGRVRIDECADVERKANEASTANEVPLSGQEDSKTSRLPGTLSKLVVRRDGGTGRDEAVLAKRTVEHRSLGSSSLPTGRSRDHLFLESHSRCREVCSGDLLNEFVGALIKHID